MIDELLEEYPDPPQPGALRGLMSEDAPSAGYTRPRPAPRARPEMPDFLGLYNQVQAAAQRPPRENSEGALARIMERAGSLADKHMAAWRTPRNDGFAFAAAMLAPTKTGHFSESLSRGLGTLAEGRSEDAKLREQYMNVIMKGLMPTTVGRSLMQPLTGQVVGTDPSVADERAAKILESRMKAYDAENARIDTLEQREDTAWNTEQATAQQRALDRAAAQQRAADAAAERQAARDQNAELRRELAANRPPKGVTPLELDDTSDPTGRTKKIVDANNPERVLGNRTPPPKPAMPPAAMKEHIEDFSDLGRLDQLDADVEQLIKMVKGKHVDLGLVGSKIDTLRNWVGEKKIGIDSTPSSRNYASYKSWLENQRNAVLLQNKGVQTEGDAIRAALEGIGNANDPETVLKRLQEIQRRSNNARSVLIGNIGQRNENFGGKSYDAEKRVKIGPSIEIDYGGREVSGTVNDVAPSNRGITRQRPSNALPDGFNWEK